MPARRELAEHVLVAASAPGFQHYLSGVEGLLAWDRRASLELASAIAVDPMLAVARADIALAHFNDENHAAAKRAIAEARSAAAAATEAERSHVEAVALFIDGDPESTHRMRVHVAAYPRDLVIAQRLYMNLFWQGRTRELLELALELRTRAASDRFLLGMHAFALAELGQCAEAAELAEHALADDAGDMWAVHARVHALHELGDLERTEACLAAYARTGWLGEHLTWHVMLLRLAHGDFASVEHHARAACPTKVSDLNDTISLLWRLELCARPCPQAWPALAEVARQRLDHPFLFHSAHLAMAIAAVHDDVSERAQIAALERRGPGTTEVAIPLIRGIHAFSAGDYDRAVALIAPITPRIVELGGSRLQRDVFHDTLLEACFRASHLERARSLLVERLQQRPPDQFWTTRRAER